MDHDLLEIFVFTIMPAGGLLCIAGAVGQQGWFSNHRKIRFMVSLLGVTRVRVLYIALGLLFVSTGVGGFAGAFSSL